MADMRRQQEDVALADRHVARPAVLVQPKHHVALELVEEFLERIVVVIGALVRSANHGNDEVRIREDLGVADRRLEYVAVGVDLFLQVESGEHAGSGVRV